MIKLPLKIEEEIKTRIIEAYKSILQDVSHDELQYVYSKFPRVYKRLSKNADEWTAILAYYAKSIFTEVKLLEGKTITEEGRFATAALYYLCEPIDVIPDHTPGTGYLDDALVINESLKDIKKINKELYNRILENVEES